MLGDFGKLIVAKGFKMLPKVQKSPDLVTLFGTLLWSMVLSGIILNETEWAIKASKEWVKRLKFP